MVPLRHLENANIAKREDNLGSIVPHAEIAKVSNVIYFNSFGDFKNFKIKESFMGTS